MHRIRPLSPTVPRCNFGLRGACTLQLSLRLRRLSSLPCHHRRSPLSPLLFPCHPVRRSGIHQSHQRFLASFIPPYLVPPMVFVGLVLSLWAYKCLMMIVFQRHILYMPSVPPYSRREKIADYADRCGSIKWREDTILSLDGTKLSLCVGEASIRMSLDSKGLQNHVVLLYFQG